MSYLNKTYWLDRSNTFGILGNVSESMEEKSQLSISKNVVYKPNFNYLIDILEFINYLPREISHIIWEYILQSYKNDIIFSRNKRLVKNIKLFAVPISFCINPHLHIYNSLLRKISLPILLQYIKYSSISKFYKVFKKNHLIMKLMKIITI